MYFSVSGEGMVKSVNRFGAEYLGYSLDDLIGKEIWTVVHPDDLPLVSLDDLIFLMDKSSKAAVPPALVYTPAKPLTLASVVTPSILMAADAFSVPAPTSTPYTRPAACVAFPFSSVPVINFTMDGFTNGRR